MKKCNYCKKEKEMSCFVGKRGGETKICDTCREKLRKNHNENYKRGKYKCIHNKAKSLCKECGGEKLCPHGRRKFDCRECGGGSFCNHGKKKYRCRECKGSQICEHKVQKYACKKCNIRGYVRALIYSRSSAAIKSLIDKKISEAIGCTIDEYIKNIEDQMTDDMNWDNHGKEWELDHNIPLLYNNPTLEEVYKRIHYSNVQPLSKDENRSKLNRYIG